ncbi:arylamine N-acetyltransferase [Nocardiopsis composta]
MALLVRADGTAWIADTGLGDGFTDPLPLRPGHHTQGPFGYLVERLADGERWIGHHHWGAVPGYRMRTEPLPLSAFAPHHLRQSTSSESGFVQTLIVQRPSPTTPSPCAAPPSPPTTPAASTASSCPTRPPSRRPCPAASAFRPPPWTPPGPTPWPAPGPRPASPAGPDPPPSEPGGPPGDHAGGMHRSLERSFPLSTECCANGFFAVRGILLGSYRGPVVPAGPPALSGARGRPR